MLSFRQSIAVCLYSNATRNLVTLILSERFKISPCSRDDRHKKRFSIALKTTYGLSVHSRWVTSISSIICLSSCYLSK